MKRLVDHYFDVWKNDRNRQPLLLRGARQVGKTYAVRQLGKSFENYIELNLEFVEEARAIFERDLDPRRILKALSLMLNKEIIPGKTLLFIDEIQVEPRAILALRYFYEMLPELHVIAAGSLIDFALEQVGLPVGRVQPLYMYPLSFLEFLAALEEHLVIEEIINHSVHEKLVEPVHRKLLDLVAEYLALGGMPQVVNCWKEVRKPLDCARFQARIFDTYRQDFNKYAKAYQIKYLELLLKETPRQLGKKFKFSEVGDYRKRELEPALNLLETAGIAHKVTYTAAQGIPLGAQSNPEDFKLIFLDVGLMQSILGHDLTQWFLNPVAEFVNKGALVEAFVGQELLTYSDPYIKPNLYYWHSKAYEFSGG